MWTELLWSPWEKPEAGLKKLGGHTSVDPSPLLPQTLPLCGWGQSFKETNDFTGVYVCT